MDAELSALLAEGRAAYDRGDMARAEHCFTEALEGGAAEFADVHHALGVVYHSWGLYAKARARLEEALRLNPKYAEASLNLAITYNDMGRYAEAQELLSASKVGAPSDLDDLARSKIANLHAELGDAYRSAGLAGEAAVEYRRALGLCPTYVDIRARLARAAGAAGGVGQLHAGVLWRRRRLGVPWGRRRLGVGVRRSTSAPGGGGLTARGCRRVVAHGGVLAAHGRPAGVRHGVVATPAPAGVRLAAHHAQRRAHHPAKPSHSLPPRGGGRVAEA